MRHIGKGGTVGPVWIRSRVGVFHILIYCFLFFTRSDFALAQIDPEQRHLLQFGYNQPIEGRGPMAGYAYYYWNQPNYHASNIVLRLAVAPVYLDSSIGIIGALGEHTDVAFGLAGGGFADSFSEIRGGKYYREESFLGHGAEASASIYHLFNDGHKVPLTGVLRAALHYSTFERDDITLSNFALPPDEVIGSLRTGFRWGGRDPVMVSDQALELSGWYEVQFRDSPATYGLGGDRAIVSTTHQIWARALFAYKLPKSEHRFEASITPGFMINPDRFSTFRLGGSLPLVSEFPLNLPGYYFQELSARRFLLFSGSYHVPITPSKRWAFTMVASTAAVDFYGPLKQTGSWNSGMGGGLTYRSPNDTLLISLGYAHGFDAIRTQGRGANSIGLLVQYDLEPGVRKRGSLLPPWMSPSRWRGVERLLGR